MAEETPVPAFACNDSYEPVRPLRLTFVIDRRGWRSLFGRAERVLFASLREPANSLRPGHVPARTMVRPVRPAAGLSEIQFLEAMFGEFILSKEHTSFP